MRKLILLMGTSASGKSSYIKLHNLEQFTISADKIRENFGYTATTYANHQLVPYLHSEHEKPIWDVFYQQLETRMANGITTIIDNTNLNYKTLRKIRHLAKIYNYETTTIDFMYDYLPHVENSNFCKKYPAFSFEPVLTQDAQIKALKTLLSNNNQRLSYRVADSVIRNQMHEYSNLWQRIIKTPTDWTWLNTSIPSNNFLQGKLKQAFVHDNIINLDKYKKIQIIGDIHNDYSALMHVFEDHEPGTAYIFLGDYLDKGTRPYSVFNFLAEQLLGSTNLYFIRGNHEDMWQDYLVNNKIKEQFQDTFNILKNQYNEQRLRKLLTAFLSFCKDYYIFSYHGKTFYCSHAGFEPMFTKSSFNLNLEPSKSLTYGIANDFNYHDPYSHNVDALWAKENKNLNVYNIHGHRNNFNEFIDQTSINLNLEGKFRWLTITPNSIQPHEINSIDALRFDQAMAYDPYIRIHELSDNIEAYNFTAEAWTSQHWNKHTSNARGLFIRKDDHQIIGRGFPKFFEIGQNNHAKLTNLEFPVNIMRKHDGFLCLVCYDTKLNKIHVYSKSGETNMAEIAYSLLKEKDYLNKINKYYSNKKLRDTTLLFEIIDPTHDHHIIYYQDKHVYPLAIIKNNQMGIWLSEKPTPKYKNIKAFRDWCVNEIDSYSWIDTIDQTDDTQMAHHDAIEKLKKVLEIDERDNPFREGVVLYGQNMMLKVKFKYYHKLKEVKLAILSYQKHGYLKNNWSFGGRSWAQLLIMLGYANKPQEEFEAIIPQLGLKLNEFDKQYNLCKLMGQYQANIINEQNIKDLWQKFLANS